MSPMTSTDKKFEGVDADLIRFAITGLSIALDRTVLALITVANDGLPELMAPPPDNTEALLEFFEQNSAAIIEALRAQVQADNAAKN